MLWCQILGLEVPWQGRQEIFPGHTYEKMGTEVAQREKSSTTSMVDFCLPSPIPFAARYKRGENPRTTYHKEPRPEAIKQQESCTQNKVRNSTSTPYPVMWDRSELLHVTSIWYLNIERHTTSVVGWSFNVQSFTWFNNGHLFEPWDTFAHDLHFIHGVVVVVVGAAVGGFTCFLSYRKISLMSCTVRKA